MDHNLTIGSKIKNLRKENNMTLKQLSEKSGLSAGFLSQLERGISTIAVDSLAKIAEILGVNLTTFFQDVEPAESNPVVRGFEASYTCISAQIIQSILSNNVSAFDTLPRLFQLMPMANPETNKLEMYSHHGEEYLYVLEGVVTVFVGENEYCLYPGDSIQIHSNMPHNWVNYTNKIAKLLSINYPNPLKNQEDTGVEHLIQELRSPTEIQE